jgi:hypothetical protein
MNGFFISITNNLLEDKHFEKMGNAVWLYMWIIDKMTDISEGQGIVNGGHPITYDMVNKNFSSLTWRTYMAWVKKLRESGYINTMQARQGLYVTVNKPKKHFGKKVQPTSYAKNSIANKKEKSSYAKKRSPAMQKNVSSYAENGTAIYIKNNNTNTIQDNTNTPVKKPAAKKATKKPVDPQHEEINKLYYETIKALSLPVLNHNTLRAKIKQMTTEVEFDKLKGYLTFMRDTYPTLELEYKPHINNALDIYGKRLQIANAIKQEVKAQQGNQIFRI